MRRVYFEEITQLALLYNYKATKGMLLSQDSIKEYDQIIEDNLEAMQSTVSYAFPLDRSKLIYFNSQDENGNWYSILKPDTDVEKIEYEYMRWLSRDVERASKQDDALQTIGLQFVDGQFQKLDKKKNLIRCLGNNNE